MKLDDIVSRDPEIMSGALVFAGTRVPVEILIQHLTAGDSLEVFLEDFPTVSRKQAVAYLGWQGTRNGALLRAAQDEGFDVLVTMDRGLPHQQDLRGLRIGILLLKAESNRLADLEPLMPSVHEALKRIQAGEILRVTATGE